MEILKENIKIVVTSSNSILIGQLNDLEYGVFNRNMLCTLNFPFRLLPSQNGISFAAPLTGEEKWVTVSMQGSYEMEVTEKIYDLYIKYYNQIFGSGLIVPEGKRIII